ncbi:hypothetical protein HYQ46_001321 [Verticillium longisporum]|nr:hypothetical protein HYQ46_001321 [Verticillium longisporum]
MLHHQYAIPGTSSTLQGLLKSIRNIFSKGIAISILPWIKVVMLLRDNMAGLDTGAYRLAWTPGLSFAGDGTRSSSIETRGLEFTHDLFRRLKVYLHASRNKHIVKIIISVR